MCGILGITINEKSDIDYHGFEKIFSDLFKISERRGKEASGFALMQNNSITVYKSPVPATELINSNVYKNNIRELFKGKNNGHPVTAIGHSRLVTNGIEKYAENNQPVIKSNIIGIHNGIIVNDSKLWDIYTDEKKISHLDSEIIFTLIRRYYDESSSIQKALSVTFSKIYGMASVAMLFNDLNNIVLATNNGSLFFVSSMDKNSFIFASERFILETLINKLPDKSGFNIPGITQLKPMTACIVNTISSEFDIIDINVSAVSTSPFNLCKVDKSKIVKDISDKENKISFDKKSVFLVPGEINKLFSDCIKKVSNLKRCKKCILPQSFPFINFDKDGVCNYCNNYKKILYRGTDELKDIIAPYRKTNGNPDVIIGFSGGRDSSYTLHYAKKVLNLNPIAYSYDWGMLTDLARRNQSRLCARLGIEHILISADIHKKRKYIRKNVTAWLNRPHPGTVPLFMAGDKQYFYYANELMKQYNIGLILFGENLLETTFFKYGFCGVKPNFSKTKSFSLSNKSKINLFSFYLKEYILNPSFVNSSLIDSLWAYLSFYFIKHNYINLFNYVEWNEQIINKTLIEEYDWETSGDTKSTWRIGDGTAAFYNYIYYLIAGFSEFDTFRSNQIREGILNRESALKLVNEENLPRYESIKWYLDTIGLNFENTLSIINKIPKRF